MLPEISAQHSGAVHSNEMTFSPEASARLRTDGGKIAGLCGSDIGPFRLTTQAGSDMLDSLWVWLSYFTP
jgi:hypothetical protein